MRNDFSIPFIKPVFKGNRFTSDQPHLPIQAFPELIAYDAIRKGKAIFENSLTSNS